MYCDVIWMIGYLFYDYNFLPKLMEMLSLIKRTRDLRSKLESAKKRQQQERRNKAKQQVNAEDLDICRTCLSHKLDLKPLFPPGSEAQRTVNLKHITGDLIKQNDGHPQRICDDCEFSLSLALGFREMCNKSQEVLRNSFKVNKETRDIKSYKAEKYVKDDLDITIKVEKDDDNYNDVYDRDSDWNPPILTKPKVKRKGGRPSKYDKNNLKCKDCGKVFTILGSYKSHLRYHLNDVVCEICGKGHSSQHALDRHKMTNHNFAWIYKCDQCDYKAATKYSLTAHHRTHTGERPFICDHCGASFHRRGNLVQHLDTHKEKSVMCPICHKLFASKRFVRMHTYKMHKEKRYFYKCIECHDIFRTTNSARKHMFRKHGIPKQLQGKLGRILRNKNQGGPFYEDSKEINSLEVGTC